MAEAQNHILSDVYNETILLSQIADYMHPCLARMSPSSSYSVPSDPSFTAAEDNSFDMVVMGRKDKYNDREDMVENPSLRFYLCADKYNRGFKFAKLKLKQRYSNLKKKYR